MDFRGTLRKSVQLNALYYESITLYCICESHGSQAFAQAVCSCVRAYMLWLQEHSWWHAVVAIL